MAANVSPQRYIIDVKRFHAAVRASLTDYLSLILEPQKSSLRSKLWDKMNRICRVREARGVLYEAEEDSASEERQLTVAAADRR